MLLHAKQDLPSCQLLLLLAAVYYVRKDDFIDGGKEYCRWWQGSLTVDYEHAGMSLSGYMVMTFDSWSKP